MNWKKYLLQMVLSILAVPLIIVICAFAAQVHTLTGVLLLLAGLLVCAYCFLRALRLLLKGPATGLSKKTPVSPVGKRAAPEQLPEQSPLQISEQPPEQPPEQSPEPQPQAEPIDWREISIQHRRAKGRKIRWFAFTLLLLAFLTLALTKSHPEASAAAIVILLPVAIGFFLWALWKALTDIGQSAAQQARLREYRTRPAEAVLINTETVGPGRAANMAAGDYLAGTPGLLAGFLFGKPKLVATFRVRYVNGSVGIESVEVNTKRYRQLMAVTAL